MTEQIQLDDEERLFDQLNHQCSTIIYDAKHDGSIEVERHGLEANIDWIIEDLDLDIDQERIADRWLESLWMTEGLQHEDMDGYTFRVYRG